MTVFVGLFERVCGGTREELGKTGKRFWMCVWHQM